MPDFLRVLYILVAVFALEALIFNVQGNLPKLPGDFYIDKFGFRVYIPFISAIIISVILTLILNFLR